MTLEVKVAKKNLSEFAEKLAKVNKRFAKKGWPVVTVTEHSYIPQEKDDEKYIEAQNEFFDFYTISSTFDGGNLQGVDCEFKGVVKYASIGSESSKVITSEDEEISKLLRENKMVCDCCKKNITRGTYLAFLKKGKEISRENVIILGKNCASNYFPFDPSVYFQGLEYAFDDIGSEYGFEESDKRFREHFIDFDKLAYITAKVTNNYTVYHKTNDDVISTKGEFLLYESDSKSPDGHHFRDDYNCVQVKYSSEEIRDLIKQAYANPTNEFGNNIHSVMINDEGEVRPYIDRDFIGIAIYSFVGAVKFAVKQSEKLKQEESHHDSEYVGNVGDKIDMELTYERSFWFETPYGFTAYHMFRDSDGNLFKWKTSKDLQKANGDNFVDGEKIRIKGTIKEHELYKNSTKETVITRCKYDWEIR